MLRALITAFRIREIRNKILLTTMIVMSLAITHMLITSNIIIISQKHTILETLALSVGAFGIYLLPNW